MLSKPLVCASTLDPPERRSRDRCRKVLRGGALEPGACVASAKAQAKAAVNFDSFIYRAGSAQGPFSLRRGLDSF
jgi:hypothetical protein